MGILKGYPTLNSDSTDYKGDITATEITASNKNALDVSVKNTASDPIPVTSSDPTTITIYNVTTPGTPNTETSQALTAGTKQLTIRTRGIADIQFAFVSGQSGTNFITIPKRSSYTVSNINISGTLFFQTNVGSVVVEIIEYST